MLRTTAHLYKDRFEGELKAGSSALRCVLINFLRYVAPCIVMMVLISFTLFSEAAKADPQGFVVQQRSTPHGFGLEAGRSNTVQGIISNAESNDYVVINGRFVSLGKEDGTDFIFADAAGDRIKVRFLKQYAEPVSSERAYCLWAKVSNSPLSGTTLEVADYIALN